MLGALEITTPLRQLYDPSSDVQIDASVSLDRPSVYVDHQTAHRRFGECCDCWFQTRRPRLRDGKAAFRNNLAATVALMPAITAADDSAELTASIAAAVRTLRLAINVSVNVETAGE